MARSIWNGTITFGLIAVPIKVHSATEDKTIHFHQVHVKDGARIKQKRICSKEHRDVPYKQVAKAYEVRRGEYVLLSQEEIDAAAGESSHQIEIEEFVRASEIDPVHYDRTYYLGTRAGGEAAYRLLHDGLEKAERAGIGRWVFHNREYLVAIRPLDGVLALHTMRFADELVAADELEVPAPSRAPGKREIEMAARLVESLHEHFDPHAFHDEYRERVLELIAIKARGETPTPPDPEQTDELPDLMAALEASLQGASRAAKRTKGKASPPRGKSARGKSSRGRSKAGS